MKRPPMPLIALLLMAASLFKAAPAAAAPGSVAKAGAEMRAEPAFVGVVIARPPQGSGVEVLAQQNEWRRVRLPDGKEGYLHEMFVTGALPGAELAKPAELAEPAVPRAPVASPATWDEERGLMKAEIARLRIENSGLEHRAGSAEAAAGQMQSKLALAERERDAAQAKAGVLERRASQQKEADTIPEDMLAQAREEAYKDADMRCAQDMARAIDEAVTQAVEQARSPEEDKARTDRAIAGDRAVQQVLHDAALKSLRDDCARQVAAALAEARPEDAARMTALEADVARLTAELAQSEAEHQELFETYVQIVTQRHEEALARDREAADDACRRFVVEERQKMDRQLRAARKESGYEAEMEKEVRLRVEMAVGEAEARWESKLRGDAYDEQRVRKDEEARVRRLCESERLTAVQQALASQSSAHAADMARSREEADLRCQVALELVLEKAAAGDDMTEMREFARERTRRPAPKTPPDMPGPAPEKAP